MNASTVSEYGCHKVVRETLTDRSHVYSVRSPSDDGPEIIFACIDRTSAERLASVLMHSVVDVSVRGKVPA